MISGTIIAGVRTDKDLEFAIKSDVQTIFLLSTNIEKINEQLKSAHSVGKKMFVHIDLADGIGKDEYGLRYLKNLGVDGIISTRTNIIKMAKKLEMFAVQRFFIVDSHSIETTIDSACASKADVVEIMPGTLYKVINRLKGAIEMPIVAGGLIEEMCEIKTAIDNGAISVSTGKKELW